ncbi:MAG TPA: fumarylacetoacetate hydrolase family protein [Pirellulales bacterium]|jgi:fumarylacetoacetate (FAA) hydrolase family protein|nr:fumarylacetoacetate hydrolase family protein [Pirellulales bacterium]
MHRTFSDLIDYLGPDNTFRHGVVLLTGTGIVPDDDFRLRSGDIINITIDGIGTLREPGDPIQPEGPSRQHRWSGSVAAIGFVGGTT